MFPDRFRQLCLDVLPQAADITTVEPWTDDAPPYGIVITMTSGSRLWVTITSVLAPGARIDDADVPVPGEPLTAVPVPALYQDGKITPHAAEAYLAATLTNSAHPEIARAYGYTGNTPAQHPGVGVEFHSGAKIFLPFAHTARAGQSQGRERYRLQSDF